MGLTVNHDKITGIKLDGMYFRIDKISYNDHAFQIVATGYASEEAYKSGAMPISDPRAYTLTNLDKEYVAQTTQLGYEILKQHPAFRESKDVFEDGQPDDMYPILKDVEIKQVDGHLQATAPLSEKVREKYKEDAPAE